MIRFNCECGRELQGRDEDAGRQARCPTCGKIITIPGEAAVVAALPAEPPPSRAVQPDRPQGRSEDERDRDADRGRDRVRPDRPPQRRDERAAGTPAATSGKALAALILGFLAFPCLIGNLFFASFIAVVLGFLALRDIGASGGRLGGKGLALTGMVLACVGLMCGGFTVLGGFFVKPRIDEATNMERDKNNLKQLGLAMHSMHDTYGYFPAAVAYRGRDGKPLLSWRVAILPFIEQDVMFKQFRFNEPWDSPHNMQFVRQMPKTFLLPGQTNDGTTHYQVFVGPGSLFEDQTRGMRFPPGGGPPVGGFGFIPPPGRGYRLTDALDGTSNTIMIATAKKAVPWTKPEDLPFDPNGPLPEVGGHYRYQNVWMAGLADGSIRPIPATMAPQTLKALITRAGGEVIPGP